MICPECAKEGQTSRVYSHGGMVTCMGHRPYYDEVGVYHNHDPNWRSSSYECSRGHNWVTKTRAKCPAPGCDYGGDNG